ncbi:type I-C CRISPR-associated protein Cas8c/Csd1 [Accumulibacter sp.]|uniref:type I-C CRISPR-associated protein Cas8c/Csd1 n=1 Tax=Accumulibacter sp. TaxID=2053492 RepID=UPI002633BF8B|nr:type I-C CRISPR-associated protein Cas8c/Csd1 [Accumulibacter sp.]
MLQALREYGEKLGGEPGFKSREVRWCIQLSEAGNLLNIVPLGDGRSGIQIERCPDMHAMNSGGKAHFLIETAQTIACHFKPDESRERIVSAEGRHRFYVEMLTQSALEVRLLQAAASLLSDSATRESLRLMMVEKRVKPADWLTWQIGQSDPCAQADVQAWWRARRHQDLLRNDEDAPKLSGQMVCLLTGELAQPLFTQPKVTGLAGVGGLAMGDVVVGFDKAAFRSFGLEKSSNAAMGAAAAQQYVDAINHLIKEQQEATRKNPSRRTNALMVYWFGERIPPEDDPFAMLYGMQTEEQQTASALGQARKLLESIHTGERAQLGHNHYYAMTLSGASGRVMVRDWMEGQFAQLLSCIEAWFTDLSIAHRDSSERLAPDPRFLAVGGALVRELKDLPASTTAALWRAAVAGQAIPQSLMAQALDRFRSALIKGDTFNHARMGLIKAYFVRKPSGGQHMKPYLNPDHPDPAYHCGRLLAVLARLQHAALGDVGAGVVQRFYPAASTAPGLTLGRLVANARNHLGKLEGGLSFWYEQQIGEVMGCFGDGLPRTLDLEGQGLFALGYYQQLAALRSPKKDAQHDEHNGEQP